MRVRELRLARGWSQAELAELSGLSIRTIQRIENGANPGLESMKRLAEVFAVGLADLRARSAEESRDVTFTAAVVHALRHYDDFAGTAGRVEFWSFALAVGLAVAFGAAIGPWLGSALGVVLILPLLAASIRRLRDAGQSPWWLLIVFAPVGGLVVIAVLPAMPTTAADREPAETPAPVAGRT